MSTSVEIRPVETRREKKDFLRLPWKLHGSDRNWVPPLLLTVKQTLDTEKHPFWKHAKLQRWNAYRDGHCVGRIAGVVDQAHNGFWQEKTAFWGFFECIDDFEVAKGLFDAVEHWARTQGMTTLRGPISPSTNHECGLQISAFDTKPYFLMAQNPAYYVPLVERAGFTKAKDLYAWHIHDQVNFGDNLIQKAKDVVKKEGIRFRHIDLKNYEAEVETLLEIYNEAWEKNWGFVPLSPEEFRHLAKEMKPILIPQLVFIVEVKGEPAGFSVFLPDLNQILVNVRNGKLFPTGLLKLLWYTKVQRRVSRGRVAILGVKQKFRSLGLASMMYFRYFKGGPMVGFKEAECSWILEDNTAMNQGLKAMDAHLYKTYRIYDKPLL